MLFGGIAVVLLALIGAGYELVFRPVVMYQKETVKVRVDRKANEPYKVDFNTLLGPQAEKYRELADEGKGLELSFFTDGKLEGTFTPLAPAETGDTDLPVREQEMAKALLALTAHVHALNNPPAREMRFMVFLDDTNGVGPDMQPFLTAKVADMGIADTVKGDNATVLFFRLTASFFTQGTLIKTVKIPAKSPAGTGASDIASAIAELTSPRGKQMYSSISTGLFNALAENGADGHTRVLVISDGLEHTPDTAQLDSRRLTPAEIERDATELAEKLQAIKRVPKLKGARIDWYLPPRTDRARQMMAVLEKVWLPLLKGAGAKIEMHY